MPPRAPWLLLLTLFATSCGGDERRGDPDLQVQVSVEPAPPTLGTAAVRVGLTDVDWTPRNGDRVVVWVSRDGIELARDTAVGQGAGVYRADDVRFEVAGPWLLTVRVETRDGRWMELDRRLDVEPPAVD